MAFLLALTHGHSQLALELLMLKAASGEELVVLLADFKISQRRIWVIVRTGPWGLE